MRYIHSISIMLSDPLLSNTGFLWNGSILFLKLLVYEYFLGEVIQVKRFNKQNLIRRLFQIY